MGFLNSALNPGADERRRAKEVLEGVRLPDAEDLQLKLEELVLQGQLTPEQAQTILQGPSAYETVSTDPRLREAQMGSLAQLQQITSAGGLDAMGKASLEDALATQRTETRGAEGAIMANARARGIGGSDLELVNRLVAQQGAATRGSRAALDTAAIAQQRRDAALAQQAQLAGGIRGQDFSEQSAKANAADAISRFNAANQQAQVNRNVDARNDAQARNLGARQATSDANVGIRNRNREYNAQLPLTLYKIRRGAAQDRADGYMQDAAAEQARNAQAAGLISTAAMAFAASDERVKTDVEPLDSRDVLADLSGSTWRYKGDASGQRKAGPMAQEFEKGPLAGAVHDTAGGKVVNYGAMGFEDGEEGGLVMSLLADINKRMMAGGL